jgi:hypothetical protein
MEEINLDDLNESDILQALEGVPVDNTTIDKENETKNIKADNSLVKMNTNISSSSDIVSLLKQLLDDKTLEISIKIKD